MTILFSGNMATGETDNITLSGNTQSMEVLNLSHFDLQISSDTMGSWKLPARCTKTYKVSPSDYIQFTLADNPFQPTALTGEYIQATQSTEATESGITPLSMIPAFVDKVDVTGGTVDINAGTVDVASMPAVSIAAGQSVNIGNTASVNVANTPAVTLSGANNTVNVGNTPAVTLSGTNTVNIGNTPAVQVNNSSLAVTNVAGGSLTVAGTVDIGNTASVNIANSPTVNIASNQSVNIGNTPTVAIAANQSMNIGTVSSITETVTTNGNSTIVNDFLPVNGLVYLGQVTAPAGTTLPYSGVINSTAQKAEYDTLYVEVINASSSSSLTINEIGIQYSSPGGNNDIALPVTATQVWSKTGARAPANPATLFKFSLSDAVPMDYMAFNFNDTVTPSTVQITVQLYAVRTKVGTNSEPNPVSVNNTISTQSAGLVHAKLLGGFNGTTLATGPQYPKYNGTLNWVASKRTLYVANSTNVTVSGTFQLLDSCYIGNLGGPGTTNFSVGSGQTGWYDIPGQLDSIGFNISTATGATSGAFNIYVNEI